jgi:hypothetical protein
MRILWTKFGYTELPSFHIQNHHIAYIYTHMHACAWAQDAKQQVIGFHKHWISHNSELCTNPWAFILKPLSVCTAHTLRLQQVEWVRLLKSSPQLIVSNIKFKLVAFSVQSSSLHKFGCKGPQSWQGIENSNNLLGQKWRCFFIYYPKDAWS